MTVTSPTNQSVHPIPPERYELTFAEPLPDGALIAAELNGTDISSWFSIASDRLSATADGNNFANLVVPGRNRFSVSSPANAIVFFFYDIVGPDIHITSVTENGTSLTVAGYLDDEDGATELQVDGVLVPLAEGDTFSATVSATGVSHFVATDTFNHVSEVRYARPGSDMVNSVTLQVTDVLLAQLTTQLEQSINNAGGNLLEAADLGERPLIYSGTEGIVTAEVYLTTLSIGTTNFDLLVDQTNADGTLDLNSSINDLVFGIDVEISVGGGAPTVYQGTISATSMTFSGDITPSLSADRTEVNISLSNLVLDLVGLTYDVPGAPAEFIVLFDAVVADASQTFGELLVGQMVPVLLSEVLNPLVALPFDLTNDIYSATSRAESLSVNGDSMDFQMTTSFATITPSAEVNPALGSLYNELAAPPINGVAPNGGSYGMGLVLSANLFNQLLLTPYEAGLFDLSASTFIDFSGTALGGLLQNNELDPADNLRVVFTAISPPFLTFGSSEDALGEMRVFDMQLDILVRPGGATEFVPVLESVVNFRAPFNISASAEGNLDVGLDGSPKTEVVLSQLSAQFAWANLFINELIDLSVAQLVEDLLPSVATIPIPSVEGFGLSVVDIWKTDTNSHLVIAANLELGTPAAEPAADTVLLGLTGDVMMEAVEQKPTGHLGRITLPVGGHNPSPGKLEFRYRVDNGRWSIWRERNAITIENLLTGQHQIEVCARTARGGEDKTCPIVKVNVDRFGNSFIVN